MFTYIYPPLAHTCMHHSRTPLPPPPNYLPLTPAPSLYAHVLKRVWNCAVMFTDESRPRACFIPAETLVQNGTAGDNDTTGGTLNQPVLGFLEDETPSGRHFVR